MTTTNDRLSKSQSLILRSSLTADAKTYIAQQSELFERVRSQLIKDYSDQWVLFENNQVLDQDLDYQALLERVRQTKKDQIVLIKKVEPLIISE